MSNGNSVESFIKALRIFSGLVKFDLSDDIGAFYVESLSGYDLDAATRAIVKLAQSAKVGRGLPSVHEILEIIAPSEVAVIDAADEAAIVAGRIEQALSRFGSRRVGGEFKEQEEFIGSLGWSVVGPMWANLCETVHNKDLPTWKAQWRMEIKGVYNRAKAGLPAAPSLPEPAVNTQVLQLIEQATTKPSSEAQAW